MGRLIEYPRFRKMHYYKLHELKVLREKIEELSKTIEKLREQEATLEAEIDKETIRLYRYNPQEDYYGSDGMNREDYPSPYDETFGDDIDPCGNIEW